MSGRLRRLLPPPALLAILAGHALLAGAYALLVPPWEAPDEPAHYRRARDLACAAGMAGSHPTACATGGLTGDAGTVLLLPDGSDGQACAAPLPPAARGDVWQRDHLLSAYESPQPPLGYLAYVPWILWVGPRTPPILVNPDYPASGPGVFEHALDDKPPLVRSTLALRRLRLAGLPLGMVAVAAAWWAAAGLLPGRSDVTAAAAALVAFLPQFTFSVGTLGNDAAAAALAGIATAILLRDLAAGHRGIAAPAAAAALLIGAALAKPTALAALAFGLPGAAVLALRWARRRRRVPLVLAAAVAGLLLAALAARITAPAGWRALGGQAAARLRPGEALAPGEAVRRLLRSAVGEFGWLDVPLPSPAYLAAAGIAAGLVAGLGLALRRPARWPGAAARWTAGLLAAGILVGSAPILLNATATGQAQGRYLFPLLAGAGALGGIGACGWMRPGAGGWAATLLALGLAAGNVAALAGVVLPSYGELPSDALTVLDLPQGTLVLQHGRTSAREEGVPPDRRGGWTLHAPEAAPVPLALELQLREPQDDLLALAAAVEPAPADPSLLPGIAAVRSRGAGTTVADRVRPRWMQIAGDRRRVLYAHPETRIALAPRALAPGARLRAGFGIDERAWAAPGDGVTFRVLAGVPGNRERLLGERHLDPRRRQGDRRWAEMELQADLPAGAEVTLFLETFPGPAGDATSDWSAWSHLTIEAPATGRRPGLCSTAPGPVEAARGRLDGALPPGAAVRIQLPAPLVPVGQDFRLRLGPAAEQGASGSLSAPEPVC